VQVQPLTLWGAREGDKDLRELPVPATYVRVNGIDPVRQGAAFTVAHTYDQLLRDLRDETSVVPSWGHAVRRHASIDLSR